MARPFIYLSSLDCRTRRSMVIAMYNFKGLFGVVLQSSHAHDGLLRIIRKDRKQRSNMIHRSQTRSAGASRRGQSIGQLRRSGSARWSIDARNGLVFKTSWLVVLVQVGLERKRLVATLAFEVLESRMSLHMSPKVGPVGKTFSAMSATVRFVARMRSHVALQ